MSESKPTLPPVPDEIRTYPLSDDARDRLKNIFTYHPPHQDQLPRYHALRNMAHAYATMVVELTPFGRSQALALTKIEESVFHANAAIARGEAGEEAADFQVVKQGEEDLPEKA